MKTGLRISADGSWHGDADPVLVLLPGLDGTGVLFRPLLERLRVEIRLLVVTFPTDQRLGYAELLPRVLATLPKDQAFVLLGESFSGPLALMAAAKRPANLRGVILCASFIRNPVWGRPGWIRHLARPAIFRLFPGMSRMKAVLVRGGTRELQKLSTEALSEVRPDVLAHRVRAVLSVDVVRQLRECPVPILYLQGNRDRVVPPHNAREIVAAVPSVKVVRIAASHWILQTQPAQAAKAILAFVRDLGLMGEPRVPHPSTRIPPP